MPDWQPLGSTHLSAVRYDDEEQQMDVRFTDGSMYEYFNVPPGEYEALLRAPSKGHFFRDRIKGRYDSQRIS